MDVFVVSAEAEKQHRARRDAGAAAASAQADDDFVRLMRAEWGRRIVWRLLEASRDRSPKFDSNAMQMARQVGISDFAQRHFLNRIFDLCPDLYATMKRENSQ